MLMVKVKVKTLGILYSMTKKLEHEVEVPEGSTVFDVVKVIAEMFPDVGREVLSGERISEDHRVLLNGREISYLPEKEKTTVKNGDEIAIIPPVGGGYCTI